LSRGTELRELLQGVLDVHEHLIPKIAEAIAAQPHDVIFLSGVGEVYPYILSHHVLHNLPIPAKDKPPVLLLSRLLPPLHGAGGIPRSLWVAA